MTKFSILKQFNIFSEINRENIVENVFPPINIAGTGSYPPAKVTLSWDDNWSNIHVASTYDVYRDGVLVANNITETTWEDNDDAVLKPDTAYEYRLTLTDVNGNKSDMSAPSGVAIPNLVLATAPTNLKYDYINDNTIAIDWWPGTEGSNPIDHYEVYFDSIYLGNNSGGNRFTNTNVKLNTVYNIAIVPVDTLGNKGESLSTNHKHTHDHLSLGSEIVVNPSFKNNAGGWTNTNNWWHWIENNGEGYMWHPTGSVNNGLKQFLPDNGVKNYHFEANFKVNEASIAVAITFRDSTPSLYRTYGQGYHKFAFDAVSNPAMIEFKRSGSFNGDVFDCSIKEILVT